MIVCMAADVCGCCVPAPCECCMPAKLCRGAVADHTAVPGCLGVTAAAAAAEYRMVSEKAGVAALVANFAEKGLGVQQLVALSGAHTIGEASFTLESVAAAAAIHC